MTYTPRDVLQALTGDRLPIFRATSPHLSAIYPFQSESGIIDPRTGDKVLGLPVGYCGKDRSGGLFFFDPVQLYRAGIVQNTNVKILGDIGNRKSAGIKNEIYEGASCGHNHLVTDRKGEYTRLANAIPGAKVLRFGTDTNLFINPLDTSMDRQTQTDLVAAMALTAMSSNRTELNIVERTLLWHTIEAAHLLHDPDTILPHVVDLLFHPPEEVVKYMQRSAEVVQEQGYELALALQRLTEGDLQGMFHKKTTPGLFDETPLLVLNCEGLRGEAAVIMITLINFFTQSQWSGRNAAPQFNKIFHDEAWDLAAYPGFVESIRRAFKLGGTLGISNYIVAHHKSNLDRSGKSEAIKDLIADSDITVIYRQDEQEIRNSASDLGLNEAEVLHIIKQAPGHALYKIGDLPGIPVEHVVWPEVLPLVETRHRLKGLVETDLPRAMV